jgi:hypothetical protein
MVRGLVLLLAVVAMIGCSGEEGNAADAHLTAPVVKPKGKANEQKARGMTEETTRGMGEKGQEKR